MYSNIDKIFIPNNVLIEAFEFFQEYGENNLEAVAIWLGEKENGNFFVEKNYFPEQENTCVSYYIHPDEVHNINMTSNKLKLIPLIQIHTHPKEAYHSTVDDDYSILNLSGCISIVFPNYGFTNYNEIQLWAVYRLENDKWKLLEPKEVKNLFQIN